MENTTERKRKSKGSLSVLDEFTGDAGEIAFTPKISDEAQKQIDEKTRLADVPVSTRLRPQTVATKEKTYGKPTDNIRKTYGKSTGCEAIISTENLRIKLVQENLRKVKPTDTPTDIGRKRYGKPTEINSLVGFQRQAFFALVQQAKELGFSDDAGNRITPPVNGNVFAQKNLQRPYKQVKDVIYELKVSGFLSVYKIKNGRGGFVQYLIQKSHYQGFLFGESLVNPTDNIRKSYGKPTDKPTDTPTEALSSSSRVIYNKETTTTSDAENFEFNMELVTDFGLTASAITRCFELYPAIDREKMQDLINRFGEFMRTGEGKRVQNARGFFISLAEQLSKGITPLDHIETSEARIMRELVEKKRAQKAEQELLEKELRDFDFEEWWAVLSPADRDILVKPNSISLSGSNSQKLMARQIHAEKYWPERRTRVLSEAAVTEA